MNRLGSVLLCRRFSTVKVVDKESMLFSIPVEFVNGYKEKIKIDAVYQDTDPSNTSKGIVFAQHGAPGSHKDFKYITPLLQQKGFRVVTFNYPGIGFTKYHKRLTSTNDERNNFAQAIMNELNLTSNKNLIIMGHSRGGENALELAADNIEHTIGLVMINSVGLYTHRGAKPMWFYRPVIYLVKKRFPPVFPFLKYVYNRIGLRVPNGEVAGNALIQIATFDFEKQLPYMEKIIKDQKIKMMYAFSGNDFLIEPEHSFHYARSFDNMKELVCLTKGDEVDNERVTEEAKKLYAAGERLVCTFFEKEDHFLQKNRAYFIAEVVESMFENRYHSIASHS